MLDPPFLIASNKTLLQFSIIFLQSFLLKKLTFLLGLIPLKNRISLAYIFPIPETKF